MSKHVTSRNERGGCGGVVTIRYMYFVCGEPGYLARIQNFPPFPASQHNLGWLNPKPKQPVLFIVLPHEPHYINTSFGYYALCT